MLKYQKQKTRKETLLSTMLAFIQVGLVGVGLIGISIRLFSDNGWFQQWLNSLMRAELARTIIIGLLVLIAGYLLKGWMDSGDDKQNIVADAMLYLMTAVGIYFVYQFIASGGL